MSFEIKPVIIEDIRADFRKQGLDPIFEEAWVCFGIMKALDRGAFVYTLPENIKPYDSANAS